MTMSSDSLLESSELRSNNTRLNSTVNELRLEIEYYQGETKRLEWEKNVLKQDIGKMSTLFKGWLHELQNTCSRSVLDDSTYFSTLVRNPSKNIADVIQMTDLKILITTCQAPFHIEYTNKAWTSECGWEGHEVLGLTCAFLQGELTDMKTVAAFTRDIQEVGYGNMRINNYRKDGSVFNVSITVFPIYDSVGIDKEPVLTHFATILEEIRSITPEDTLNSKQIPISVTRLLANNMCNKTAAAYTTTAGELSLSSAEIIQTQTQINYQTSILSSPLSDRRLQSRRFEAECRLTSENFEQSGKDIRISDLLRLMLTCVDAMVLTDKMGRIVHCNREWVELTGYSLSEVEGSDCRLLQGSMTDHAETRRSKEYQRLQKPSSMTVVNYRKDGSMFLNHVTTLPIRGGYKTNDVTHYCALLLPQLPECADSGLFVLNSSNSFDSESTVSDSSSYHLKRQICDVNKFDCEDSDDDEYNSDAPFLGYKTPKTEEAEEELEREKRALDSSISQKEEGE